MIKEELLSLIKKCLDTVTLSMIDHEGIEFIMKSRLKFEKWFQVELLKQLLIATKEFKNIQLKNEYPASVKSSKKGETIDLALLSNSEKYAGIELKIVPTNYDVEGFSKSTKAITDSINEMINDLSKPINDGYEQAYSIGLIFPFPKDPNHRNNSKDFAKQEDKLRSAGELHIYPCRISSTFDAKYYILFKRNS